ncbi:recombinase family protein [Acidobacteria bacterium AH-259-D05]|nr:recombinase family protein [Acidobacteria bacterium AH-259-D05]
MRYIYARVSTKNNGQDPQTQLIALREYAKARGFQVFHEYVDVGISGSKESRPSLDRLMDHARKRRFDAVLVARFDRFARSTWHLIQALEENWEGACFWAESAWLLLFSMLFLLSSLQGRG